MENNMSDLEKILEEKLKLEQILHEQFSKTITVMFTDIKGSTSYFETQGDIAGRSMIHLHNSLVVPIITENSGLLIKTIGDATMSAFDDPGNAIRAAGRMQANLRDYNAGKPEDKQIHIRIGLNYGTGIVDEKDIFGDVVNVASRIEALANADEILLTEPLYRQVKNCDEFIFRYFNRFEVKGKAEPIRVYRLLWHEEDLHLGKTRAGSESIQRREDVFTIEASVAGQILKVSAFESGDREERPVKNYIEIPFRIDRIKQYTGDIILLFNRSNRRGKIGNELLVRLKELGGLLYDELLPHPVKERIADVGTRNLIVSIDDQLVHIPWELLFDGKEFLCQRFSIGRTVRTRQSVSTISRAVSKPLKMQVLADPRGDLDAAYEEGVGIRDEMGKYEDWLVLSLKTTSIGTDYVKAKIRNFDIVHYAGHAEHVAEKPEESGWLLEDGKLNAQDILGMNGLMPMPSLVFSNACQTGHSDEWKLGADYEEKIFGLANAFLLAGVQHYIGTFWEIPDEAGHHFAISFYQNLAQGETIGEAVRRARQTLIERYGEDTIVWAGYMLYGDPSTRYVLPETTAEPAVENPLPVNGLGRAEFSYAGASADHPAAKGWRFATIAIAALALAAGLAFFALKHDDKAVPAAVAANVPKEGDRKEIDELVATLAANYRAGKFEPAVNRDDWSSRPLSMAVMDVKMAEAEQGAGASSEKFVNLLNRSLRDDQSIIIVERQILDKLLAELKLGSSALADPATTLKLGKVFSARFIVTGAVMPEKSGQTAILRLIDTETTEVRKMVSAQSPSKEIDKDFCNDLGQQIGAWARGEFPLKGRIVAVAGEQCTVNLGQAHGLKKGSRLEVVAEAKKGSGLYAVTGELVVSEVGKDTSVASIVSGGAALREKEKVRVRTM